MRTQICRSIYIEDDNYIMDGTYFVFLKTPTTILLYGILFLWIILVTMVLVDTAICNMKTIQLSSFDDRIALGLATAMFFALISSISKDKFVRSNFCLMNKHDPICSMDRVHIAIAIVVY